MKEAMFFETGENQKVRCTLCPHHCSLTPGRTGLCGVRENVGGKLVALTYCIFSSLHVDPIEKKPLYHFYPGSQVLSLGSFGCNLNCLFCQNHEIAQCPPERMAGGTFYDPPEILNMAREIAGNIGVAYTYNEPLISYETILETGDLIHGQGLKNIMVSNGYIDPEPLKLLFPLIDAWNIDLKAFSDDFYRRLTTSRLSPVLETLKNVRRSGSHLEVTNLVIPGLNDNEAEFRTMVQWIAMELGRDTPLHLSRYFPRHQLTNPPTPEHTLVQFYGIAKEYLHHVYVGNILLREGQDTRCPECQSLLVRRTGYRTEVRGLAPGGRCGQCGTLVIPHYA
jgi:pyruvate formate lyase activating enzyme